jgi:hypothetical protein
MNNMGDKLEHMEHDFDKKSVFLGADRAVAWLKNRSNKASLCTTFGSKGESSQLMPTTFAETTTCYDVAEKIAEKLDDGKKVASSVGLDKYGDIYLRVMVGPGYVPNDRNLMNGYGATEAYEVRTHSSRSMTNW